MKLIMIVKIIKIIKEKIFNIVFNVNIIYHVPEGKEHGLSTIMDWFEQATNKALIVCLDSSSNDYEQHKELKNRGYDILVIDHHEAEHYSEDAIVINNQLS